MTIGPHRTAVRPRWAGRSTPVAVAAVLAVILGGCVLAQIVGSAPAWAHDTLVSSTPKDGAALSKAPDSVVLRFDEAVGRRFGQVVVTGPDGTRFDAGALQVRGVTVTQPLRQLTGSGAYHVAWRVVSADGHPVSGRLTFTLRGGAVPARKAGATPSPTQSGNAATAGGQGPTAGNAWPIAAVAAALAVGLGVGLRSVARSRRQAVATAIREPVDGD